MPGVGEASLFASILTALLGIEENQKAGDLIEEYDNPGGVGRFAPDGAITPETAELLGVTDPETLQTLNEVGQRVTGGGLAIEQVAADQAALERQAGIIDAAIAEFQGGTLGAADRFAAGLLENPEAIDQLTFDRLVAQAYEQNAADAAAQQRLAQDSLARSGAGPGATALSGTQINQANAQANSTALRDLLVQRELANKRYGLDVADLASRIGSTYGGALAGLRLERAGREQAPDLANLGAILNQDEQNKIALSLGQSGTNANTLFGLSSGLADFGNSRLQAQAIRDASRPRGLFGLGGNPGAALASAPLALDAGFSALTGTPLSQEAILGDVALGGLFSGF